MSNPSWDNPKSDKIFKTYAKKPLEDEKRISMLLRTAWVAITIFLCGCASVASAAPTKVETGLYVNQIYGVSLKENKFTVDFYVWFRSPNKAMKIIETIEVVNGKIDSKTGLLNKQINGVNYSVCRIVATINKFWDVSKYPLDKHELKIEIEDSENDTNEVQFITDIENTGVSGDLQVRGWTIKSAKSSIENKNYTTNFGDISLPSGNKSSFSRYVFSIQAEREGHGHFFKLFGLMFLATFVAFLAFLIPPSAGPRFGLGTGALFAAAANSFVVNGSLPESLSITLADQLQLTTISLIFCSIAISTISLKVFNAGNEKLSKIIDKAAIFMMPLLYASLVLCFIWISSSNTSLDKLF